MTDIATLALRVDALEVKTADRELSKLNKTGGETERTVNKLATAAKTAAAAFGIWKLSGLVKDVTMAAARYETLGISMHTAGNNAGYTSKEMDGLQKSLEKTGISMIESRNTLIQMSAANMDLANATKLARTAQDLAVVGNTNSSDAFNRLVYGIKSGQTEILRTLGLNVQFEQSYKKLADQLGKNVSALTEAEKMQARTNIVIEAGAKYAGIYEAAMTTAAKQISSLARYHENLSVIMGSTFTEALAAMVAAYTVEIKGLNEEAKKLKEQGDLQLFARGSAVAIAAMGDAFRAVGNSAKIAAGSVGLFAAYSLRLGTIPWSDTWKELGRDIENLKTMQTEAFTGLLGDTNKLRDATIKIFDDIDAHKQGLHDKEVKRFDEYARNARAVAEAYSGTAWQIPALQSLAGGYGGDIAAAHGAQPKTSDDYKDTASEARIKSAKDYIKALREQAIEMGMTAEQSKYLEAAQKALDNPEFAKQIYAEINAYHDKVVMYQSAEEAAQGLLKAEKLLDKQNAELSSSAQEAMAIYADTDPIYAQALAWEKLTALMEKGVLDSDTAGKAYSKMMNSMDKDTQRMNNTINRWADSFTDAMTKMVTTGKADFKSLADSVINDIIRMRVQKSITDPLVKMGGGFLDNLFSFAGGGFTGSGARSGGVDGMGGFPAILHPNETVVDHTKGQSAAPSITVVQNINIDSRSDASVIVSAMQRAKEMAKAEIMQSLQRGGSFATAVGRA